jgi:hypothetical protein
MVFFGPVSPAISDQAVTLSPALEALAAPSDSTGETAWQEQPTPWRPAAALAQAGPGSSLSETPGALDEALGEEGLFGDRVRLNFSAAGAGEFLEEILNSDGVIPTGFSEGSAYWRRGGGLEVDVLRSGPVTLKLDGRFHDSRTPDTGGRGGLNIGGVTGRAEQSFQDFGIDLGLFGDRLTYSGGLAFSRSDGVFESEDDEEEEEATGPQKGGAQWHRFDAKVLDGGPVDLSLYGLYGVADTGFSFMGDAGEAGLQDGGETGEFGGTMNFGWGGLSFKHKVHAGLDSETEELSGTIGVGLLELSLTRSTDTSYDEENPGAWMSRRQVHSGDLSFDLDEYRGLGEEGFDATRLVPATVTFGASLGNVEAASGGPSDLEQGFGFGLGWEWDNASTSIDVWRDFYDSQAVGFESADNKAWSVELEQDFYGDNWDLSFYLSLSQDEYLEVAAGSLERDIMGGVSFSLRTDDLPDLSLSFDVGGYDLSEEDYASMDHEFELRSSLDFSKFLPRTDGDFKPYLKFNYYARQLISEDSDTGSTSHWGHAGTVILGLRF